MTDSAQLAHTIYGLGQFFKRCWDAAREGHEIGGDEIQDWGEELGLLTRTVATAPCGEGCVCEEYVGDDFPTDCFRPVPMPENPVGGAVFGGPDTSQKTEVGEGTAP